MSNHFKRRDLILKDTDIEKIENTKIALFGLGGVGGYALEALVRMGIQTFFLCDGDTFSESNLNRQILSLESNIGLKKVDVAKNRALGINSNATIYTYDKFINDESIKEIDLKDYYIVDCIDDVKAKVLLAKYAKDNNLKIISMMGAGNRLNAEFLVSDIKRTEYDPLSKKLRKMYKNSGIDNLKVVYTKCLPISHNSNEIASISYVVGFAGLKIAEEVIKDILNN